MKKHWFMLLLAILFSSIFWTLSGIFIKGWVRQAGTANWPTVKGEVTSSSVSSHRGSKGGRTYKPEVSYRYSVAGVAYTSDSITLCMSFSESGGGYARRTVAAFPAGKTVAVYYDPTSPGVSVLFNGLGDREWQTLSLLALFVSVPAVLWMIALSGVRSQAEGRVGTVRVLEPAPGFSVIRDVTIGPWVVGAIVWFVGLVATLLAVMVVFDTGSRAVLLTGWGLTLLCAAGGWTWRRRWITAGRCDTVIDQTAGLLIPPRGRKAAAEAIPLTRVTGTKLKQDSPISTNKVRHWRVHLVVQGEAKTRAIADVRTKADAKVFDDWFKARLGLPVGEPAAE